MSSAPRPRLVTDALAAQLEAERQVGGAALRNGDGGGTSGVVPDDALKTRVDFLHTAFLWLAGLMVTGLLAIVTVVLTTASTTNSRIDKLADRVDKLADRVGQGELQQQKLVDRLDLLLERSTATKPKR